MLSLSNNQGEIASIRKQLIYIAPFLEPAKQILALFSPAACGADILFLEAV